MPVTTDCPSQQVIDDLLHGKLTAATCDRVAGHLETCARCTTIAESLRHDDAFTKELRRAAAAPEELPVGLDSLLSSVRQAFATQTEALRQEDVQAMLAPAQAADELGRLGPYRLLSKLGVGGMGIVYLAEHVQLKRPVALKVLRPSLAAQEKPRRRFLAEAQAMAAIRHERVVTIHDVSGDSGLPYLAMEHLDGEPLDRWHERVQQPGTAAIIRIGRQIAEGLAAAHACGLIHRDIKPSNIWLEQGEPGASATGAGEPGASATGAGEPGASATGRWRVKILDFGLARPAADNVQLTEEGMILGTPAFMSPEQAAGENLDERSDLFSLGSVLYLLCTGELPFPGSNPLAVLSSLATHTPRPVRESNPTVTPRLGNLIGRLLSKDPANRPASAGAVAEELRAIEAVAPATVRRRPSGVANWCVGLAALAAFTLLTAGVIIRIRTRDGKTFEVPVPEDAAIEIVQPPPTPTPATGFPLDALRREDIPVEELAAAGNGNPLQAPPELVAVLGDSGLQHWSDTGGVAFSPNGKFLASAGCDGVRLWDAGTFRLQRRVGRATVADTDRIAISPDSKWIACTTWTDGAGVHPRSSVLIAEAATGSAVRVLQGHTRRIWCLAFSPDGQLMAAGSVDGVVKVWNATTGEERFSHTELPGQGQRMITTLAFSRDGKRLATGTSNGGVVRVHEVETGKEVRRLEHPPWCDCVAFSPDGTVLLTNNGKSVRVWDTAEWKEGPALELSKGDKSGALAFRPDGKMLVGGGMEQDKRGYLCFWSWPEGKALRTIRSGSLGDNPTGLSFAPDGNTLAVSSRSGAISLWDPETGMERPTRTRPGHAGAVMGLAVTPDGRTLVTGGQDGTVRLWDMTVSPPKPQRVLEPFGAGPSSLALSSDGKVLATSASGGTGLWAVPEGRQLGEPLNLPNAHLVRDGSELIGNRSSAIVRIGATDRRDLQTWPVTPANPGLMTVSSDGRLVATLDRASSVVKVWDAHAAQEKVALPPRSVHTMRFSPDNKRLALCGPFEWSLWEVGQGKEVLKTRLNDFGYAVAFRPDGKQVATLTGSGLVQLWDATGPQPLRTIRLGTTGHASWHMIFSPDGRHLILGNPNGTIFVLRLAEK